MGQTDGVAADLLQGKQALPPQLLRDSGAEAADILMQEDRYSYVDMISLLRMGADILHAGDDGIIIRARDGLVSAAVLGSRSSIEERLDAAWPLICVHDRELRDHLVEKHGYTNREGCWSFSWRGSSIGSTGQSRVSGAMSSSTANRPGNRTSITAR